MSSLFENAGTKIKNYAKGVFLIECLAAIIGGIVMIVEDEDMLLWSLLIIVGGIAVAYIMCLFLSAFGELVESSTATAESNEKILNNMNQGFAKLQPVAAPKAEQPAPAAHKTEQAAPAAPKTEQPAAPAAPKETHKVHEVVNCPKCGKSQFSGNKTCWNCGAQLK